MLKRALITCLIFFCITFGLFYFLDVIGVCDSMSLKDHIANAIIGISFYFLYLLINTRKHKALFVAMFCIIGIIIILIEIKFGKVTASQVFEVDLEFVLRCIIAISEYIVSDIQAMKYKEAKVLQKCIEGN